MSTRSLSLQAFGFTNQTAPGTRAGFGVWPKYYDGSIVAAEKVFYTRPPEIPPQLADTFHALRDAQMPSQLVTIRKAGVPEARDGSHLDHALIPADAPVQIVGMTI